MATSGSFTGSRGGGADGPYLTLLWSRIDVDEVNNRSLIRLTLQLISEYDLNFSSSKSGNLDGSSFTFTSGYNGPTTKTLKTIDKWITHDSDGGRTENFSASFDIAITWSGSYVSSLSVSGNAVIDTIARASDFTAFTLSNTVLNTSTAVTVNYTLARKSTAFSQLMTLKRGPEVIKTWTTSSTGALTQALSTTEVNAIIASLTMHTTGTLTLTMQTKSGSTNIGSSKSISQSFSLNSAIKPTATSMSVSIFGTGRDKTIAKYIQGISKVTASFTRTAGYGASISSSTIVIRRQSDDANSQTIASNSGTTANPVTLSGVYEAIGTVTDSRGRTATVTATFTVDAYSAPKVLTFSASRVSPTTTISNPINVSWSALGTSNPTDILIEGISSLGVTTALYTLNDSTAGSVVTTNTYTGQSDANSFIYKITVTDSFGKKAIAEITIGTTFVELTIAKGMGVGIGKVHERGSLDVAGDAYVLGKIRIGDYDIIVEDNNDGTRGLELGNGLFLRNGYLEMEAFNPTYGAGRMQSYYDANGKRLKIYGRNASDYTITPIDLEMMNGGGIVQGDWIYPSLLNGWGNYTGTVAYRKTTHGTVRIKGNVTGGPTAGDSFIFQLATGYRPTHNNIRIVQMAGVTTAKARVDIQDTGYLRLIAANSVGSIGSWLSLDGLEFPI